jgi:hypothetical protein
MIGLGSVLPCKDQSNLLKYTYKGKKFNIILSPEGLSKKEELDIMQEVLIIKDKLPIFVKLNK